MVRYKYIGKDTYLYGKTLWEIVGNLKNYGVGRLITRGVYSNFEHPSFFKIVKTEAYPYTQEEEQAPDKYRKCIVFVEKVFRGVRYPQLKEIHSVSYKPDYRLIPKEEEEMWYKNVKEKGKIKYQLPPTHLPVPPLLKYIINEERKSKGEPGDENMLMKACTHKYSEWHRANQKSLDNIPEIHLVVDCKEARSPLYKDVETYRNKFLNKKNQG